MIDHGSEDKLRPVLKQLEKQLDRQIAEACSAPPAAEETTGQMQRLSETLADASEAARTAAALRRRSRASKPAERGKAERGNAERHTGRDSARPATSANSAKRQGTPVRSVEARQADAIKHKKE